MPMLPVKKNSGNQEFKQTCNLKKSNFPSQTNKIVLLVEGPNVVGGGTVSSVIANFFVLRH